MNWGVPWRIVYGYFWYERNEDDIEIFTGCTVSEYQPEVSINEAWPLINELRDLDIYLMIDQGKYGFDVATFKSSCRNCDSLGTVTVLL